MGCDIHLFVEVKVGNGWEMLIAEPDIDRYYPLFAKMGNVRNSQGIEPLSDCRGMPENPSKLFEIAYNDGYEHSLSWLSSDEVKTLSDWVTPDMMQPRNMVFFGLESLIHCYLFGNSFGSFKKYPDSYPKEIQDFRFIFWFDS